MIFSRCRMATDDTISDHWIVPLIDFRCANRNFEAKCALSRSREATSLGNENARRSRTSHGRLLVRPIEAAIRARARATLIVVSRVSTCAGVAAGRGGGAQHQALAPLQRLARGGEREPPPTAGTAGRSSVAGVLPPTHRPFVASNGCEVERSTSA